MLTGRTLQYFTFCAGSLNVLSSGLHLGWPSPSLPHLLNSTSTIGLSNDEGSWIAVFFFIGNICGPVVSTFTLDVIGRKTSIILTSLPIFAAWLIIYFASSVLEFYIARFMAGLADGMIFCCMPLYFAEISDPAIRGLLLSGMTVMYLLGVFLINLVGSFWTIANVVVACSSVSILSIILCIFIPESPHFHLMRHNLNKAKSSLQKLSGNQNVDETLNLMIEVEAKQNKKSRMNLFTVKSCRRSLFILVALRVVQQFTGVSGILFYIHSLFEQTGANVSPVVFVSVYYSLQLVFSVVNAILVDKLGRRPLLITSVASVILALCIISTYFSLANLTSIDLSSSSWVAIGGFFLFIMGYTIGLHSIPILFSGELFPLEVKTFGVCVLDVFYGLTATAVSKFFQFTKDEYGIHVPFITFTICTLIGLPFVLFCVPETKNKSLEEIQTTISLKKTPLKIHK
ncbi:hypothetical protein FQA39_LY12611 [Lamprigera yunnana]|nr:hypothetical protein FQA39_LY12611 [Lamprigera yunnana]